MRRKDGYFDFAKRYVKTRFRKREVAKLSFTEEELEKIRGIKSFLENIVLDNTDDMLKDLEGNYKRFLGVSVKVNCPLDEELTVFINHFFNVEDFNYSKDDLYIPKAIYHLAKNRHCEMFFCTSLLRAAPNEFGFVTPERRNKNVVSVSSLYLDLDLPADLQSLDDETLLKRLEYEFWELFHYLHLTVVRSGGGLHLYTRVETLDLNVKEMENRWKHILENLNFLLRNWGSDLRCCGDKVRLLRVPYCVNRKAKYGPAGRMVKVLREDYTMHSLDEIEEVVDYAMRGGNQAICQAVLDELMPCEEMVCDDEEAFYSVGEWEDDIFTDNPEFTVPQVFADELRNITSAEQSQMKTFEKHGKTEECEATEHKEKESKGEYFNSYKGIALDYGRLPDYEFFQVKDILFFLSNRESSQGIRHSTLFFCGYSWYHFMRIRDEETFIRKCQYLNTYFKPMFSDRELVSQAKANFKYIQQNGWRGKYIRSSTIAKYYKPTEEEKWLATGNYFEEESIEWEEKKRRKHAKNNLEQYHKKKAKEGYITIDNDKRKSDCYQYLVEHPETSYREAKEKLGISTTIYYELISKARKQSGYEESRPDYSSCLKENPDLSFKEYHSICGGSYTTYARYKKRFAELNS